MDWFGSFEARRKKMVQKQIASRGIRDPLVLAALEKVPRHLFVREASQDDAYGDFPLSIGQGQTISQPYIVALMTEALGLTGLERTLEIGTGSGYQTAILAELSACVFSVERIKVLQDGARTILDELGYTNIEYLAGDGTLGWPEHAPYDAIMVTAAGPRLPEPLTRQVVDGGRIVIPRGDFYSQDLILFTKRNDHLVSTTLSGCRFVNLIGVHGWKD